MKKLTSDEVKHVAKLAKLDLTEKEVVKFQPQLSEVVNFVSQLSNVDTKDAKPTNQTTGLKNRFRPDQIKTELYLAQNKYFKVKLILKKD